MSFVAPPPPKRSLRSEDVADLWGAMSTEFGTRVVPKETSLSMHLAGLGLGVLRIQKPIEFMERYTTVIGRRIYVPYTPGDGPSEAVLWRQASTAAHEHQHVLQAKRDGFVRFASRYLRSAKHRAAYEAEAYGGDIELLVWARRKARSAKSVADGLAAYGVGLRHREAALETLLGYEASAAEGVLRNEATQWAAAWLSERLSG